jgi:hypothetical protein
LKSSTLPLPHSCIAAPANNPVVHWPEATLLGGAVGDMCGKQRAGMNID